MAVGAKATNPAESTVEAAVNAALPVRVVVQVLDGGGESNEAAMSSPVTPLGQSWTGVLGGLAVAMRYDPATKSVHGTVRNTLTSDPVLRTGRASPEVGYEDSRRAWSPEAREPESRTGSNVKPVGRQ